MGNGEEVAEGDEVLSYHGPVLYKAKVLRVLTESGVPNFYLHYTGWSKKWDEWVTLQDILPINDETLSLQNQLNNKYNIKKKYVKKAKKRSRSKSIENTNSNNIEQQQQQQENRPSDLPDGIETPRDKPLKTNLPIPLTLKRFLMRDWEKITHNLQLLPLPRSPNVVAILDDFVKTRTKKDTPITWAKMLASERSQYDDLMKSSHNLSPSRIYGAEHLLRLFVKFPSFFEASGLKVEQLDVLYTHLTEVLKYLQKNSSIFCTNYVENPDYERGEEEGSTDELQAKLDDKTLDDDTLSSSPSIHGDQAISPSEVPKIDQEGVLDEETEHLDHLSKESQSKSENLDEELEPPKKKKKVSQN